MLPVVMESDGVLKKRMNAQNIANVQRFQQRDIVVERFFI